MAFVLDHTSTRSSDWASSGKLREGLPIRHLKKDAARAGNHYDHKDRNNVVITEDRIDKWVTNFKKMRETGDEVPVVKDHSDLADDKLGEVVDAWREGDELITVCEFVGDDSIKLAQTVKNVSVLVEEDYGVSSGTVFDEALVHVSVSQRPVIGNQRDWEKVAPRSDGKVVAKFSLVSDKENEMNFETLGEAFGIEGLTAENAEARLTEFAKKSKEAATKAATALSNAKKEGEDLKGRVTALSAANPKELDRDVAESLAQSAEEGFDSLVEAGKILPAVRDKLKSTFIGAPGKRNGFALSVHKGADCSIVRSVIQALRENDPVKLGEQTKKQIALSAVGQPGNSDADAETGGSEKKGKALADMAWGADG